MVFTVVNCVLTLAAIAVSVFAMIYSRRKTTPRLKMDVFHALYEMDGSRRYKRTSGPKNAFGSQPEEQEVLVVELTNIGVVPVTVKELGFGRGRAVEYATFSHNRLKEPSYLLPGQSCHVFVMHLDALSQGFIDCTHAVANTTAGAKVIASRAHSEWREYGRRMLDGPGMRLSRLEADYRKLPADTTAICKLASEYARRGREYQAGELFKEALFLDPSCAGALDGLKKLVGE